MTRYEAFIDTGWRERGFANVIVARIRGPGAVEIGVFLLDRWCLGVKDAFFVEDATASDFEELVQRQIPANERERLHPATAKALLDGAVAYAEGLGFAPARDWRKARRVLSGIDASPVTETFEFGRDGKPLFIAGEDDSPERIERVLAILAARLGPDGFHYVVPEEDLLPEDEPEDEFEAAREYLEFFLEDEPDDIPGFHEFSGLVTALHVCPNLVPPGRLFGHFWGPGGRNWQGKEEVKDFMDAFQTYWDGVPDILADAAEVPDEDAWPLGIRPGDFDDPDDFASAVFAWCRGFMSAVKIWPEAWGDALERAELQPHWELLRAWSNPGEPDAETQIRKSGEDGKPGEAVQRMSLAVMALYRALRPGAPRTG